MNSNDYNATDFAHELAEQLEGWSAEEIGDERDRMLRSAVIHDSGARVVIRSGFDTKGRWSFFPSWPQNVHGRYCSARDWGAIGYGESEPHMTSAQGRSASSIAGQFRRAFEPAVLEIHAKVVAARDESIAWHQRREERARELAQVSGGELRMHPAGGSDLSVYVGSRKRSAGSVTFQPGGSDDSVRIEGYLTQREALDLGALLNPVPDQQEQKADRERRLQLFASTVIELLDDQEEWSSDTLEAVQSHALAYGVAFSDSQGMFRGHAWARMTERQEKGTQCLMCQRQPISEVDDELCDDCLREDAEIAERIDAQLYGYGEVK
jgi:hypothetical protein